MDFDSLFVVSETDCNFQNEGITIELLTTRLHLLVYGNFCKRAT